MEQRNRLGLGILSVAVWISLAFWILALHVAIGLGKCGENTGLSRADLRELCDASNTYDNVSTVGLISLGLAALLMGVGLGAKSAAALWAGYAVVALGYVAALIAVL